MAQLATLRYRFRLAPMSPLITGLTVALLSIPPLLLAWAAAAGSMRKGLVTVAVVVSLLYLWVWLRFRPTAFLVRPVEIEIVWPLKHRSISRNTIDSALVLDRKALREKIGWGTRIGAGGLWGGFGWLKTAKRGIVQMYISRLDRFVWIERTPGHRAWIITPERPEEFVAALRSESAEAG